MSVGEAQAGVLVLKSSQVIPICSQRTTVQENNHVTLGGSHDLGASILLLCCFPITLHGVGATGLSFSSVFYTKP